MAKIVSVNEFILHPKEFNGRRVVTFKDIDLVHSRAEGTARKRFADNKERFIEGIDYFVRKTDEAKKEFGIVAPKGLFLLTETGYLMLVKSFTDDLAWTVQRELVNNYFRTKEEKPAQENSNRKKVVNIPENPEFQIAFNEIKKTLDAIEVTVQCMNRYVPEKRAMEYAQLSTDIAFKLAAMVSNLTRIEYKTIPEPY